MLNLFPIFLRGLILLHILLCLQSAVADVTYYVAPGDESSPECPDGLEPCHNIDYYLNNKTFFFSPDEMNVTMKLYGGIHTINTEGAFEVFGLNRLMIIGLDQNVVIKLMSHSTQTPTQSIEGNYFAAKNLTFVGLTLSISVNSLRVSSAVFQGNTKLLIQPPPDSDSTVDVMLTRCEFREQSFLKASVTRNLTIRDCEFLNVSIPSANSPITTYNSMVYLNGTSKFIGNNPSAISAYFGGVTVSGNVIFQNNTAINGGAMVLHSSTLYIDRNANVSFINNRAANVGGAIFVDSGSIMRPDSDFTRFPCFYQILHPFDSNYSFELSFTNNSARSGGNDIYGASLKSNCQESKNSLFDFDAFKLFRFNTRNLSSVSGSPSRVCICESNIPQCTDPLRIFMNRTVYPGETITLSVAVVGGDFGTTIGKVYYGFLNQTSQASQLVSDISRCTDVTVGLYLIKRDTYNAVLYLSAVPYDTVDNQRLESYFHSKDDIDTDIKEYNSDGKISFALSTTPVFVELSFLQCPLGLYLKPYYNYGYCWNNDNNIKRGLYNSCDYYYQCDCPRGLYWCFTKFKDGNVRIEINGGWIGINSKENTLLSSSLCPFDYCNIAEDSYSYVYYGPSYAIQHYVDPRNLSTFDLQCALNRSGTLCGGCRKNFSLAIGSSRCLPCPNNNNLALIILFAVAGIFLVFLISILNMTVSQGMVNGLILYANIVWSNRSNIVRFEDFEGANYVTVILAWLNLDFGIETCFVRGLDAYWKTWLQFIFPFYTAGLFLIGLRFSTKLSKLFGDRSVPTLATLLFLSYTKLLRTIISSLGLARLTESSINSSNSSISVWSVDGNIKYGDTKHIFLILAALACLILLWLPYTLLLLLVQCLRKSSNSRISRWITRYKPVFDAYYAPLNDKHHYWFGVLLVVDGVVLLQSSLLANVYLYALINWYLILFICILLLFYVNVAQVYRRTSVLVTESLFLMNLIMLMVGIISGLPSTFYYTSVVLAYVELCGIIIWTIISTLYSKFKKCKRYRQPISVIKEEEKDSKETKTTTSYVQFRDSVLVDSFAGGDLELH